MKRFAPSLKKEKITPKNMILNGKMILARTMIWNMRMHGIKMIMVSQIMQKMIDKEKEFLLL